MSTNGVGTISADADSDIGANGMDLLRLAAEIKDVAPSLSDPRDDLTMPHLPMPAWKVLLGRPTEDEAKVLQTLCGLMAWKAAGRLRRAYGLKLWPKEDPADVVTLPSTFPLARQAGADGAEIQNRVNHLENWACVQLAAALALTKQVLAARDLQLWKDSRMTVLQSVMEDWPRSERQLQENALPLGPAAPPTASLSQAATVRMIQQSAVWGLQLARTFAGRCSDLTPADAVNLRPKWWKPLDQGRTAGCVGCAVAALLRNQWGDAAFEPSARYLWQGAQELDGESRPSTFVSRAGTSLRASLQLAREVGCATEGLISSKNHAPFDGTLEEFYGQVASRKIAAVVNLGMDKKMWLAWLLLGRPMVCAIRMNAEFAGLSLARTRLERFDAQQDQAINHAIVIAGWRLAPETFNQRPNYNLVEGAIRADSKTKNDSDSTQHFAVDYLVRNSVGLSWGQNGDAWVPHRLLRQMAFEAYGVLLSPQEVHEPGPSARRLDELSALPVFPPAPAPR